MSHLIDVSPNRFFLFDYKPQRINISTQTSISYENQSEHQIISDIQNFQKKKSKYFINKQKQPYFFQFVQNLYFANISVIWRITYFKQSQHVQLALRFVTAQFILVRIKVKPRKIAACHYLLRNQFLNHSSKISFNMQNGIIKVRLPHFCGQSIYNNQSLRMKTFWCLLKCIKAQRNQIQNFYNFLKQLECNNYQKENFRSIKKQQKKQKLKIIKKYYNMVHVKINISEAANQNYYIEFENNRIREQQSISKLFQSITTFNQQLLKNLNLYQNTEYLQQKLRKNQFILTSQRRQQLKSKIIMPIQDRQQISNYISNSIVLDKTDNDESQLENATLNFNGGFTRIYSKFISFRHVISPNYQRIVVDPNSQPIKKFIAVKRAKQIKYVDRIRHEKSILKQIKNGKSIFFVHYYMPVETQKFKNDLLMDYINSPNLVQYVKLNQIIMSIETKLNLVFMIVQALRYLKNYEIVHLDCKPANIFVIKNQLIKLIDFGQSYHPKVCLNQTHLPGFSVPYGAPQIYYSNNVFSEKNDIFSIGVILHELLFCKVPFYPHYQKSKQKAYQQEAFLNYYFLAIEQNISLGDPHILKIMISLINKCLNPDPKKRPELDWIAIILKLSLEYSNY